MSGVPVKARNSAFGQRRSHVQRQRVVLAAVRFVGQHDHVGPVAEHLGRLELVNQREDVAMVLAEQLPQLRAALRMAQLALCLADRAAGLECLGDLVVQLHAVGDHHERPVAWHLAQNLLREEHHRETLAGALRLPEHAAATVALLRGLRASRRWRCSRRGTGGSAPGL